ncbi:ABC transporter permease [Conexibacter sp. CPCC 206217]|uniref:ABC transporter permease n=1 Tax=Conexibacter sp. CPCC 206217 TaxID=3064574 RepID=UPI0027197650|nr:ABC transporter permease [Conexibacter sp. CPCC 206217]MDO8208775.1 ABC transporter permease [Conexibacter sp. CPCC 206217]
MRPDRRLLAAPGAAAATAASAPQPVGDGERPRAGLLRLAASRDAGLLLALALVVLVVTVQEPTFLSAGNLREMLSTVAILAVLAAGQTLVVLTRNIDLSVGAVLGLTAYLAADLAHRHPSTSIVVVGLVACAAGAGLGAVNGLLVTVGRVPAIVATLGTLYMFRGLTSTIAGSEQINAGDLPDRYLSFSVDTVAGIPNVVVVAVVVLVICAYVLSQTRAGRELYAVGSSPESARLAGLRPGRLVFGAYVAAGLLAGLGGLLWSSLYAGADATTGTGLELQVIAAVVVGGVGVFGGTGTVGGAALGALFLGAVQNGLLLLRVSSLWLQAVYGIVILLAVGLGAWIAYRARRAPGAPS